MRLRVVVALPAQADIDAVAAYLGAEDARVEEAFFTGAERALELLARHPRIGRRRSARHRFLRNLRSWPVPGFPDVLVFYRVVGDTVHVLRVLHGARDVDEAMEGHPPAGSE